MRWGLYTFSRRKFYAYTYVCMHISKDIYNWMYRLDEEGTGTCMCVYYAMISNGGGGGT